MAVELLPGGLWELVQPFGLGWPLAGRVGGVVTVMVVAIVSAKTGTVRSSAAETAALTTAQRSGDDRWS